MITNLHFIRPYWLLDLLPCLFFMVYFYKQQGPGQAWRAVCDANLLKALLNKSATGHSFLGLCVVGLMWLLTILALSGPSWQKLEQPVYQKQLSTVLVVDLSPNMQATDISPSRWVRAQYKILDILKQYQEGSIGLVVFSEYAYVVSPLTQDSQTIASLVKDLSPSLMPSGGDNIAAGLLKAQTLLTQAEVKNGHIILLTASNPTAATTAAVKQLVAQGNSLSILGIGSEAGAPLPAANGNFLQDEQGSILISQLNSKALKELAQGGKYLNLSMDNQDIKQLLESSPASTLIKNDQKQQTIFWEDKAYYLLGLIIPVVLVAFRRGWLEKLLA